MSSSIPRVIVYGYDASPFYQKLTFLLAHYKVEWALVKVLPVPPRPMLSDMLGITYRRIPVMFLDGQAYFDTILCARVLDATFGGKPGHGPSLYSVKPAIQSQLALGWAESVMFRLGVAHIPKAAFTPAFSKDRSAFTGSTFDGEVFERIFPMTKSQLLVQLDSIEQMLESKFIMGDEAQYIDFCLYTPLNWIQAQLRTNPEILPQGSPSSPGPSLGLRTSGSTSRPRPRSPNRSSPTRRLPRSSSWPAAANVDAKDPLVVAGWVKAGESVIVTPTDTGKVPQQGKLVNLDARSITISVNGKLLAHFPRQNFDVRKTPAAKM